MPLKMVPVNRFIENSSVERLMEVLHETAKWYRAQTESARVNLTDSKQIWHNVSV
jgi:hypothetical protein